MFFNQRFDLSAWEMRRLGVFNPLIEHDSELFVDPKLVEYAGPEFTGSSADLTAYFQNVVDLLILSQQKGDQFWNAACKQMEFKEKASAGIGFSKAGRHGNGIGPKLAKLIITQAADILPVVGFKPNIFELIGVFTKGLGCDRLSDMIVSILSERFYEYTERIARELGIYQVCPVQGKTRVFELPSFSSKEGPILLFPKKMLRPLPIAADIGEALDSADLNEESRSDLNKLWSDAAKVQRTLSKKDLQSFIAAKPKSIYQQILSGYERSESTPYDFDKDIRHISDLKALASEIVNPTIIPNLPSAPNERLELLVTNVLRDCRKLVEENRLSELLFNDDGSPKKEIASQRLIYAVADIYARLYNVDVSREPNAGNGAADFKFSVGHVDRVIIEIKLSSHARIRDAYFHQLPAYAKSEGVSRLVLLIIQVDDSRKQLDELISVTGVSLFNKIQIEIIDARKKPSASRLKNTDG